MYARHHQHIAAFLSSKASATIFRRSLSTLKITIRSHSKIDNTIFRVVVYNCILQFFRILVYNFIIQLLKIVQNCSIRLHYTIFRIVLYNCTIQMYYKIFKFHYTIVLYKCTNNFKNRGNRFKYTVVRLSQVLRTTRQSVSSSSLLQVRGVYVSEGD